ncbi:HsdR family type I site-specific deoxyribonuclease [Chryseobacterium arthrosphaerae]|uniref:type I restriction endonuclease subunit R n=1 Tax=Chryseobacterium arthrosphaerae TaxID=651561 RepID=UPI0023E0AD12|nr:HsdR family type I site-specific deoxyribonuclease [Chryseobacterium arthrosphaerae]WES98281.1 HsdR family type I site-specific deoxyribonuclease [Chryseobacterium arthrosphaerae]
MGTFNTEAAFELALVTALSTQKGWSPEIIKNATEEDLIKNWASILFENNKEIDRLNDVPLTDSEMQQILTKIQELRTPLKLNGFINGRTVTITRDNPADTLHLGKEVSLKIYDRREIAGGKSRYQIVQQPRYKRKSEVRNDRRGDVLLLINGMPLIHIELKRTGVHISQAVNQIEKYTYEGHFTGLFSLIQIFVAMTPEETVYFANPGSDGIFNKDYQFHWADFNNEPINDWRNIASELLSIPMAHQLIGFYTVADNSDGILKVMRSYQFYAANAISNRVATTDWKKPDIRGGYIWHTTGSGKTMTSFKSAQLIATSKDADKVIFLMDRIELGTQSLREYRGFSDDGQDVQATEDTYVLINKLKSSDPADTLIVTSIQKMSNIEADEDGLNSHDLEIMRAKKMVIIVDEAHRTVFGDTMLPTIRKTFPNAVFFGFTGTPIQKENSRKDSDTSTIFGNELHRYSLADGIRDKNVLGFDPYKILTYKDRDLRKAVALHEAKAVDEEDALSDPKKNEVYIKLMNPALVKMAGDFDTAGRYQKGIEDYIPRSQYEREEHQEIIVKDIKENWTTLSRANKFHAIFATSSIEEAIAYFKLFKQEFPELKVSALFDPHIDNNAGFQFKEEGLEEILLHYNETFRQNFTMSSHARFKKDLANRLAHKKQYKRIHLKPEEQLDLLIVVDQMLTGFDSKWVNTLYLDKRLEYENIIQAFSRTNRLFGPEKPFGTIRYYRYPHTMERNIDRAVKLYSGDRPYGLFVEHLDQNLERLNYFFNEIKQIFENAGIFNFEKLPDDNDERAKFAVEFKALNRVLESAKIQGFHWDQLIYEFTIDKKKAKKVIEVLLDENTYNILLARYKELFTVGGGGTPVDVPFEIDPYIVEIDTGIIDSNYMNSRFVKFLKSLEQKDITPEQSQLILDELHKSFATLSQEEQKFANVFLNDVRSGNIILDPSKSLTDYIVDYQFRAKNLQIQKLVEAIGVDPVKLKELMTTFSTEANINDYGRFDALKDTVDRDKAKSYFEQKEGNTLPPFKVSIRIDNLLKEFILKDGMELE